MRRTAGRVSGEIYTDGLTNVLAEPEFARSDEARRALKLLENVLLYRSWLRADDKQLRWWVTGFSLAARWLGGAASVFDGHCTLRCPGFGNGTLGVLGPMRMSYAKTIPTVRYVAGLLSDLVNDAILVNKLTYVIARSRWLRRKRQTRAPKQSLLEIIFVGIARTNR